MTREGSQAAKRFVTLLVIGAIAVGSYYIFVAKNEEDGSTTDNVNATQNANSVNASNQNDAVGGPELPTSYNECVEAGYPVQESYPQHCSVPGGETFTQDIGNELEMDDQIQITKPRPTQTIPSPLTVTGKAVGSWYFEASFPIILLNADGIEVARTVARAQGDWMTTAFVPFTATLEFPDSVLGAATLVLEKDNPSGLSENNAALRVPVVVK